MYSGMAPSSSSSSRGVQICVEPTHWRVKEISFDGVEQRIPPPTFEGLVASNARSINWRNIVGKETSFDFRPVDDDMDETEKRLLSEITKIKPSAGPWAIVARSIHSAIQEMNILLDTLCLLRTPYMDSVPVSSVIDEQKTMDQIIASKIFQFTTHKKALSESAAGVIMMGEKSRYGEGSEKDAFFNELRKMRENWRIRKLNNLAVGDLGYHVYGPKFRSSEVFDILKHSMKHENGGVFGASNLSCPIQVEVPLCLARRTRLVVSIQDDSENSIWDTLDDEVSPVDEHASRSVHWEKALKWAQNTLMLGDAFMQLRSECVDSKIHCASTDSCIMLNLFGTTMLRIEIKHYPFQEFEIPLEGNAYLTRSLRELYINETTKKRYRNQQFVTLRPSSLPENLDMRGSMGISAKEIAARMPKNSTLLSRIIDVSNHYILVNQVVETIRKYTLQYPDPQLQFKFHRCTNSHSQLAIHFSSRFFEQLGKYSFFVRICTDNVIVITKECQHIHCRREMNLLQDAFRLLTVNYQIQMIALLAKHYSWQIMHSNNNAFNTDGVPAPTLYLCNQLASKQLFVQCAADGSKPQIFIKANEDPSMPLDVTSENPAERFRKINNARLPGSTLLRKIDCLLLTFQK